MSFQTASAADKLKFKSPLKWLKDRSAESRFNVFSKEHDRARAMHFRAGQQTRRSRGSLSPVQSPPTFERAEPTPQAFAEPQPQPTQPPANPVALPVPAAPRGVDAIRPVAGQGFIDAGYQNTTSDPSKLKKVTSILPYADYSPLDAPDQPVAENLRQPEEIDLTGGDAPVRAMEATVFQWQPSNLWHYPLYFEDPGLERTGHTFEPWLQPFYSVSRFSVQLVGMPYQMTLDPVCKKQYALGWYRPGECAPKQVGQIPWNTKAVINQGAVITGAVFALP